MKIAVGCDHRGYAAKQDVMAVLKTLGHQIEDFGCDSMSEAVDYPDIAYPLACAAASEECDLGVLIDGNGLGMSIVANKIYGVRAANVHDEFTASCAREQHHCNIICLAADLMSRNHLCRIVEAFLLATLASGRHTRRIDKLRQIENSLAQAHAMGQPPCGKRPNKSASLGGMELPQEQFSSHLIGA